SSCDFVPTSWVYSAQGNTYRATEPLFIRIPSASTGPWSVTIRSGDTTNPIVTTTFNYNSSASALQTTWQTIPPPATISYSGTPPAPLSIGLDGLYTGFLSLSSPSFDSAFAGVAGTAGNPPSVFGWRVPVVARGLGPVLFFSDLSRTIAPDRLILIHGTI